MSDSGSYGIPDPSNVNLDTVDMRDLICYLNRPSNDYDGREGARISAIFVVLIASTFTTLFPVLATRTRVKIPLYVYLFARYFGAGVIIATAFIHLLDPAYDEIGPASCVGMTGGWAQYSWPPALALTSSMLVFLMDFVAERWVEKKYGLPHLSGQGRSQSVDLALGRYSISQGANEHGHQHLHSGDQDIQRDGGNSPNKTSAKETEISSLSSNEVDRAFRQQIAAFLILEFGVIFHSVIIGLTLGTVGEEFTTLYPVIVFHQAFEGLGIGARLSAIPFPKHLHWLPWVLCLGYGLCTPIAIAIGLGVHQSFLPDGYTASIVSGVLDAISAGILIYTGFVELLARDFLFNPERTQDDKQLAFMTVSVFLGTAIMALLGKWA